MPTKPRPPCPRCRRLTCDHKPKANTKPVNEVYRDPLYRRNRKLVLSAWREAHGDFCPGLPGRYKPHFSNQLTTDHIVPVSKGGTHDPTNLTVLCRTCNSARGAG